MNLILRPEKPKTETIAEFFIVDNIIQVKFNEFLDDFRLTIKKMKFKWDYRLRCWIHKVNFMNDVMDRTAEVATNLLDVGFCVLIIDDKIREKIISKNYKSEIIKYISRFTDKNNKYYFSIHWNYDNNFYTEAKRITSARWNKPNIIVSPEHFEEVLDFAKIYSFVLSNGAKKLVEDARQIKESSIIIRLEKKSINNINKDKKILDIPKNINILDEFKD